jgi:tRNA nucleotidyltransferase (CCA-adding enzyme)
MPALTLDIPPEVHRIAARLIEAGFDTWCVGGAVRDNLLGHANSDVDLATAATPDDVMRLFKHTVPIGVEHGTVAVLDTHRQPHEVTTFRRDVRTDGRHAEVAFGVSLDEDLARRDFTINAIAYHPVSGEWRDPFDGQGDLERRLIRAVGDPERRFREDYLRILRALRFAARFDFAIDARTWDAMLACVDGLEHLSAERVRDEWFKGLTTAQRPSELVRLWGDVGGLQKWMAEVVKRETRNVKREVADQLPRDPVLITAYLSDDPVATLTRLKCSRAEIERGRSIAVHRETAPPVDDEEAVRRWMSQAGAAVDDVVTVAVAEGWGAELRDAVERVRSSGAPLTIADLAVTGNDLIAAGVPEGPEIGARLRNLLDAVLEDPAKNTKEELLGMVKGGEA